MGYEAYKKDDTAFIKHGGKVQRQIPLSEIEQLFKSGYRERARCRQLRSILKKYRDVSGGKEELQKELKEKFGIEARTIRDLGWDKVFSIMGRHVARAEESYLMLDVVERFLKEVRPDEETFSMPVMKDSEGFGFTEAPRGSLMHFTKVRNGKIDNYQIVSATLWNCAPRNDTGMRGALEEALIGVPVPDIENPVNIARLIRAFDP